MPPFQTRRAFTLLEMAVTLVLLGLLVGLAVVSWAAFVDDSDSDAGGALLDRVTLREQAFSRDWGGYTAWPEDLSDLGTDVVILNGTPSTDADEVSVAVGSRGSLGLAVKVDSDSCVFRTVDSLSAGGGSATPHVTGPVPCSGQLALPEGEDALMQDAPIKRTSL